METIQDLVTALSRNRSKYTAIEKRVETEIKEKLRSPKFLWESRVKSPASLEKKLKDRTNMYENEAANVANVWDLVGCRIIVASFPDVSQIEEFVQKTFIVVHRTQHPKDNQNIVDSEKRFRGYDALHLYVELQGGSNEQCRNQIIEIQVMSGFMWVYATLHHDVVYKKLHGEPTKELLQEIDVLRGLANIGELATEIYNKRFIALDHHSELQSRVESAVDLDARSQSVRNLRHDKHRVEPSIAQEFEDPALGERANALIRNQTRNKAAHLEGVAEARQILLQRLATFKNDGPSVIIHLRTLHDLAVVERKLSLTKGLDFGKRMEHLDQAERYIDEAVGLEPRSGLVGAREQMTLERYIVRGLRAKLEFGEHLRPVRSFEATRWLLGEASAGIRKALEDLEKVDVMRYEQNTDFGLEWITYFRKFHTKR